MYYRDEDPARTSSPDDCFNSFMSNITGGRSDDLESYEKRPIDFQSQAKYDLEL